MFLLTNLTNLACTIVQATEILVLDEMDVGPTSISSIYLGFAEFRAVFAGTYQKKWHVEPSRNHAGGKHRATWEEAGPDADLPADAVFDCRGLLPNTRECYTSYDGPTAAAPS